jgi:hypothetical protein
MLENVTLAEHLRPNLRAQARARAGARDDDTGRSGNQERRDLADQTIANGENGEGLDGAGQRHVVATRHPR